MDPEVVLVTQVWKYLTIKELGNLLQVCKYVRSELPKNIEFTVRMMKFLQNGIKVLDFSLAYSAPYLDQKRKYEYNLERVRKQLPVILFSVSGSTNGLSEKSFSW